jgi:translation elongation factor EF-Ts
MAGRVETYIHSDNSTPNKAASLVEITCETDFSARTDEFIAFSKAAAKYALAAQSDDWKEICDRFPGVEDQRVRTEKQVKEKIAVRRIVLMKLTDDRLLHAERNGLK